MKKRIGFFLLAGLCGCGKPLSVGAPLPEAVSDIAPSVEGPAEAAIDELTPHLPKIEESEDEHNAACRAAAAALIIRWETSSPTYYRRFLRYPIWPGGSSGVTWGVGYDGGRQSHWAIASDWREHPHVDRLAGTSGISGRSARNVLPKYRDIETSYEYASWVFEDRVLREYENQAARVFRDGFESLRPNACAALVSVVYNRGSATAGDNRREVRKIRDVCVPDQNYPCIAREIRSMRRLWRGSADENGLSARREAEAKLAETP